MKKVLRQLVSILPTPLVYYIHHGYHVLTGVSKPEASVGILHKLPDPAIVAAGPFNGLRYLRHAFSTGSAIAQCLLGTYEIEVQPAVEKLCALNADRIITIGAGEGYYTVGMAMRNPQALSIAYEMFKPARHLLGRVARANNVSKRLRRRGMCTTQKLSRDLSPAKTPIVICDVDSAEDFLLDPAAVPELKKAHILVELHDHMCPGVSSRIAERFQHSHDLARFDTRGRTAADLPKGVELSAEEIERHIVEHRGAPQAWFLLTPRQEPPRS
jgi:hypothetical protein